MGTPAILSGATCSCPAFARRQRYVLDTKPDPRHPLVTRTIEASELAKAGYSRPHTVHCGPDGIFMSALGGVNGAEGPGGIALIDHETFEVIEPWELDRGAQFLAYDVWWHLNYDTLVTSEWATPSMIENGLNPEDVLGRKFGHHVNFWNMSQRKLIQRRPRRPAPDGARAATRPRPLQGVGLRRRRHQRPGPVRVGVAVAPEG